MLLADILEIDIEVSVDLITYCARNADAAGLRQRFEPRRHVDAIAGDIAAVGHDVAEIDADPIVDPLVRRERSVTRRISRWIWIEARSAASALVNSASSPSPAVFTMRPPCDTIAGSTTSSRIVRNRANVPVSSRSINRV